MVNQVFIRIVFYIMIFESSENYLWEDLLKRD